VERKPLPPTTNNNNCDCGCLSLSSLFSCGDAFFTQGNEIPTEGKSVALVRFGFSFQTWKLSGLGPRHILSLTAWADWADWADWSLLGYSEKTLYCYLECQFSLFSFRIVPGTVVTSTTCRSFKMR
jgi:hypothetical protein